MEILFPIYEVLDMHDEHLIGRVISILQSLINLLNVVMLDSNIRYLENADAYLIV